MNGIVEFAQNMEKLVLVFTNICLAIYSVYSTIKVKRWKQTAEYIGANLVKEEEKTIKSPKTKDKLVFASPPVLKAYMKQVKF